VILKPKALPYAPEAPALSPYWPRFRRSPRALAFSALARKRPSSGHRWASQKCQNL